MISGISAHLGGENMAGGQEAEEDTGRDQGKI
jgi:hypothetical protein